MSQQLVFEMVPRSKSEDYKCRKICEKNSDEYRMQCKRNNVAVKKSCAKSHNKVTDILVRMEKLKKENGELEGKINMLAKEASLLKELLLARASGKVKSKTDNCDTMSDSKGQQIVPDAEINISEQ